MEITDAALPADSIAFLFDCWAKEITEGHPMIEHTLDTANSILYLWPKSAFEHSDFVQLAKTADPFIAETGGLAGLIIEGRTFPGWESLGAMTAHFRFVKDHHKHIKKVAIVTDSPMGNVAEHLASHFVSAEIKHFPAGQIETARQWVMNVSESPKAL